MNKAPILALAAAALLSATLEEGKVSPEVTSLIHGPTEGNAFFAQEALRALVNFPITVMAGTADVKTTGRFFPKGPRSMRQGANRYERAHNYIRAGHGTAAR